jgi:hypothetical protein
VKNRLPDQTPHNHGYFADVNSDLSAYLLGLIAADGCVRPVGRNKQGREIRLKLRLKDRHLVELARGALAPQAVVHEWSEDAVLQFRSVRMAADLAQWGVIPMKTYSYLWPERLAVRWHRSFLLGYFDGNGYAAYVPRAHVGTLRPTWALTGRREFLARTARVIESGCGLLPNGPYANGQLGAKIQAVGSKALVIDAWLHAGSQPGLDRKVLRVAWTK